MARLVLVNGTPGSGKSTLARRYAQDHPLALALDVDVVRSMLGRWVDQPTPAGLAARALAAAMAETHLHAGHDVVVPQLLARPAFLLELEALADRVGVPFVEVFLVTDATEALGRLSRRSAASERPEHRDARLLLERAGGAEELARVHARLADLVATRPRTRRVTVVDGQVERTYAHLLAALES